MTAATVDRAVKAASSSRSPRGTAHTRLAVLGVAAAFGVFGLSVAYAGARAHKAWADPVFWTSLLVIVVPIAFRLLGREAGRSERLHLLLILGVSLFGAKVLQSPDVFANHDELGQYRATVDILSTGRLFGENPIVAAYAFWPGLESVTGALSSLSGLPLLASGLIVIGAARLLLLIGLFGLVNRITGSARAAGIAALIYIGHPNYLFFDAQFAYESLAIGLAAMTLLATAMAHGSASQARSAGIAAVVLTAATVVTHHFTSYALAFALVAWAGISLWRDRVPGSSLVVPVVAQTAVVMAGGWWLLGGSALSRGIAPVLSQAFDGLIDVVARRATASAPFSAASGYADPPLERAVGLMSVCLLLVVLPFGLWASWRRGRVNPLVPILGLLALMYPVTLALRLSPAGSETANRASGFIFVGLGLATCLAFGRWVAPRTDTGGFPAKFGIAVLACAVGLNFLGGLIVGWAPYARLPGGYQVGAASRSVDPESVRAARWANTWLEPRSRIFGDGSNVLLLAAYAGLYPDNGQLNGRPVSSFFVAPTLGPAERDIIRAQKYRYIVVDRRLSTALPRSGHYFEGGEPSDQPYKSPLPLAAFTKFDRAPGLDRIFSSEHIVVYDARQLWATG